MNQREQVELQGCITCTVSLGPGLNGRDDEGDELLGALDRKGTGGAGGPWDGQRQYPGGYSCFFSFRQDHLKTI